MHSIKFTKGTLFRVMSQLGKVVEGLKDGKDYVLEIKEDRHRRSLDANAYFWTLCSKFAEKTRMAKTDIYKGLITEIGGNNDIVCAQKETVDRLCGGWQHNGIGWVTQCDASKIDGCTNVWLYYGSSTYDTAQMSRLIELMVQECKQQGIETLPPVELARLVESWK